MPRYAMLVLETTLVASGLSAISSAQEPARGGGWIDVATIEVLGKPIRR